MKNGYDINELMKKARNGGSESVLNSLKAEDARAIKNILSDKAKVNELLNSKEALKLINMLGGGKKNG